MRVCGEDGGFGISGVVHTLKQVHGATVYASSDVGKRLSVASPVLLIVGAYKENLWHPCYVPVSRGVIFTVMALRSTFTKYDPPLV